MLLVARSLKLFLAYESEREKFSLAREKKRDNIAYLKQRERERKRKRKNRDWLTESIGGWRDDDSGTILSIA